MQQRDDPQDYAIAMGETHSVKEFVEKLFEGMGVKIERKESGVEEKGKEGKDKQKHKK